MLLGGVEGKFNIQCYALVQTMTLSFTTKLNNNSNGCAIVVNWSERSAQRNEVAIKLGNISLGPWLADDFKGKPPNGLQGVNWNIGPG